MPTIAIVLVITTALNATLGVLVYLNNPHRRQNTQFLMFSAVISIWSVPIVGAVLTTDAIWAARFVRLASYWATLIPVAFNMLCLAIDSPASSFKQLLKRTRVMLIASQLFGIPCFSVLYLQYVYIPTAAGTLADVTYGPYFPIYNGYFIVTFISTFARAINSMRSTRSIRRTELQYIILGFATTLLLALTTQIIVPMLTGSSRTQPFGPLSMLAMNAIIAHGVATQRIMDVGHILHRITAYSLIAAYLAVIYAVTWFFFDFFLPLNLFGLYIPHMLSAIVVALLLAPANGFAQKLADRFLLDSAINVEQTLQRSSRILQSVTWLDELLGQFAALLKKVFQAERVAIMLRRPSGDLVTQYPLNNGDEDPLTLTASSAMTRFMAHSQEPLVAELMVRRRPTPDRQEVVARMTELDYAVAIAIRHKGELQGLILLGPRLAGRIYGAVEQDILQLLGNQLGVAIENAKLYTEVQDARIYNNNLLDNLVNGVVATDQSGRITVFNREAARILQRPADVVGQSITSLPAPLHHALATTLETQKAKRDQEYTLLINQCPVVLRAGTTTFRGHEGDVLGAQLVFSDITRLKALEQQVRHNDRLASLGTLSAGMAHEIKNPLVSIKTFTELLPSHYDDPEFRNRFSSLVGSEVQRIDRIVNQLLRFARPAKAHLQRVDVHGVLRHSLDLVQEDLRKRTITLDTDWEATQDGIAGDRDLLQQVFVNFFMNAMEAMQHDGTLTVETRNTTSLEPAPPGDQSTDAATGIHILIADTGEGIDEAHLTRIFDPFFTTKSNGVGLGLAVAHRIITEHEATVKAEKRPGGGTVFHLVFPLAKMSATP